MALNASSWQMELHVYKNTNPATECIWFFSSGGAPCVGDIALTNSNTGLISMQVAQGSACNGFSGGTLSTGLWHSIIVSYDGTNYRQYTDNALSQTFAYGPFVNVDDAGSIGLYLNGNIIPMTGGYVRQVVWINSAVCTGGTCPDFAAAVPASNPTRAMKLRLGMRMNLN